MSQVPPSSGSPYSSSQYGQHTYGGPSASSAPGAYPPAGQAGYGQPYGQQAPYGAQGYSSAPAYGTPGGYGAGPVPQVRSTTPPKFLLGVGIAFLVSSIVIFAVSLATILGISGSLSEVKGNGTVSATLENGNVYGIYSGGLATCQVTAPNGTDVPVGPTPNGESFVVDGTPLIGVFTPTESGDHTITCQSASNKPVYVGLSASTGGLVGGGLGVIGSLLLGLPGLAMTVGGAIWLVSRRSKNKQAQAAAQGYPGAQL